MQAIEIFFHRAGLQTTVQDAGRWHYQNWGVPVGGAMDQLSMQIANWLVGNPLDNPVLEITILGPHLEIQGPCQIAISGADLCPKLDGKDIPLNETISLKKGALLSFGRLVKGCRAYLAIGGTWQIHSWLNSYSAAAPNSEKWTPQSSIQKGNRIRIQPAPFIKSQKTPSGFSVTSAVDAPVRVLPGPEFDRIPSLMIAYFFSQNHQITAESNRMGFRLASQLGDYEKKIELISSAVFPGTIQITHSGQAIILMRDAQTVGGYPRFLNVISADLHRLAQAKPGDILKFSMVSFETARLAKKEIEEKTAFLLK